MSILSAWPVNIGLTLIGAWQEKKAYEEAREANIAQWQRGQDALEGLRGRTEPQIAELVQGLQGQYRQLPGDINRRWTEFARGINRGYEDRTTRGMGMLEGAGQQERMDINQAYRGLGAANLQDLTQRGLGYSSALPTMRAGVERERQGSLGRLGESLRAQRLETFAGLSGDALRAREGLGRTGEAVNLSLRDAQLQARERLGMMRPEWDRALTGNEVNWLGNLQHQYPTQRSPFSVLGERGAQMAAAEEAQKANEPSTFEQISSGLPFIGSAVSSVGGLFSKTPALPSPGGGGIGGDFPGGPNPQPGPGRFPNDWPTYGGSMVPMR